jgi:hypothetical protein
MNVSSYDPSAVRPPIGSHWLWEPKRPLSYVPIEVTEINWNGEEWWIRTRSPAGVEYWGDLSRFWEAVTPDTPKARAEADARRVAALTYDLTSGNTPL